MKKTKKKNVRVREWSASGEMLSKKEWKIIFSSEVSTAGQSCTDECGRMHIVLKSEISEQTPALLSCLLSVHRRMWCGVHTLSEQTLLNQKYI